MEKNGYVFVYQNIEKLFFSVIRRSAIETALWKRFHINFFFFLSLCEQFLSRLNCVQKETMWSLILYVVYVVFFAKMITVSTYNDVFPWNLDTMTLG